MRILLTNDDGIGAPGLWALAGELALVGDLVVAAPGEERSGAGTSISLRKPIRVQEVAPLVEGVRAFSVSGTPADSAIIAIRTLCSSQFDLVVSGINRGSNLGHDVYVSGTVGAAMQGYLHGIRSLAVSMYAYDNLDFSAAARVAALISKRVGSGALNGPMLLNVNVPNLSLEGIRGVEVTRLSSGNYCDKVERESDERGEYYLITRHEDMHDAPQGTDLWAVENGRVSVTPLPDRAVDEQFILRLRPLMVDIEAELAASAR
jgi:5'-nucleotidase